MSSVMENVDDGFVNAALGLYRVLFKVNAQSKLVLGTEKNSLS